MWLSLAFCCSFGFKSSFFLFSCSIFSVSLHQTPRALPLLSAHCSHGSTLLGDAVVMVYKASAASVCASLESWWLYPSAPVESWAVPSAAAPPQNTSGYVLTLHILLFHSVLLKPSFFPHKYLWGMLCEAAVAVLMLLLSQSHL